MSTRFIPSLSVLLFALLVAGGAGPASAQRPAAAIQVPHAQGQTRIVGVPQKVIVTDWAAFDNLTSLGVAVAGVPQTRPPAHLAARWSTQMLKVGSMQEPEIEAIAAAQPDLVIVAGRSRKAYRNLSKI